VRTGAGHTDLVESGWADRVWARTTGLALVALVVAGCTSRGSGPPTHLVPVSHKPEVLARGVVAGKSWVLTAFSSGDGNLCMGINDQLPLRVQRTRDVFVEAGCGFGPFSDRDSGPFDEAQAGGHLLMWGPAPAGAVRVRLDTYARREKASTDSSAVSVPGCHASIPAHLWVRITHRLPGWAEPGGWFITHTDADGCGYLDATFYDRNGREIAEHWW
jgi:hypothetical protein